MINISQDGHDRNFYRWIFERYSYGTSTLGTCNSPSGRRSTPLELLPELGLRAERVDRLYPGGIGLSDTLHRCDSHLKILITR